MIKYYKDQKGYWDHTLLLDIFKDPRFSHESINIYVVPGEYADVKEVNKAIKKYDYVILMIVSDEQSLFEVEKIEHKNIKIWVQYPKPGRHDDYYRMPLGYTPHTRPNLELTDKPVDVYFSGQVTHSRRRAFMRKLKQINGAVINETDGFSKGLPPEAYIKNLCNAKVIPSPGGPVCPDSFRTYEALECGASPIADAMSEGKDYIRYLFGEVPLCRIDGLSNLKGYIEDEIDGYPSRQNEVQAWWIMYKRELKQRLLEQSQELSGVKVKNATTIVVPVSPIKSHPSTEKLDKCIQSIRHHFKDAEIIITFDGVRPEQEDRRADYNEFIRRVLFKCNTTWNVTPLIFQDHTHQVGMMREALKYIETDTVVYCEGDTGFVLDREIDWKYCVTKILDGTSNLIRFHFEGRIPDEHTHLMIEKQDNLIQTAQWSQRPHIASTAYYKRVLNDHFSIDAKSFIEDKMHGIVHEAYKIDGIHGWQQHRIHIYAPEENIKYSVDFDGREGEAKFDKSQVF